MRTASTSPSSTTPSIAAASCTGSGRRSASRAICLFLSIVIGIVGAWLQGSRFTLTTRIVQGYVQFFRNTPPLVQLSFFYFAVGSLLPAPAGPARPDGAAHQQFRLGDHLVLASSPAPSTSRSFAPASRRCPEPPIEAAESLGYSAAARPISTSCCRSPSASACRRSTTTSSTSSRRRRSPTRSACRSCSMPPRRSGPRFSTSAR